MSDEEKLVSHYRLKTLLRKDGFGAVYFAEDTRDQKECVLRVIELDHPTLTRITGRVRAHAQRDHPLIEQIRQRMKRISELKNTHILPVNEFGEEHIQGNNDIIFYMVSPYEKASLLSYWSEHTSSSELIALEIVSELIFQAAEALFYVHKRGLAHQYVRLSSFMLRSTARSHRLHLYLTDFWFADITAALLEEGQISQDLSVYLASEQLAGHAVAASDQYALAILAYELLLGYRLSQVDLSIGLYERFLRQRGVEVSVAELELARRLDLVLARALADDASARYKNIEEFALTFRAVAGGELIELEEDTAKLPAISHTSRGGDQGAAGIAVAEAGALAAGEIVEELTESSVEIDETTQARHPSLHKTILTSEGMEAVSGEVVEETIISSRETITAGEMVQSGTTVAEEETLTIIEEERTDSSAGAAGAAGFAAGVAAGELLQHATDISSEQTRLAEGNAAAFAAGEARQRELDRSEEKTVLAEDAAMFAAGLAAGEARQRELDIEEERTETRESNAAAFAAGAVVSGVAGLAAGEALAAEHTLDISEEQTQIIPAGGAEAGGAAFYEQETDISEEETQIIPAAGGALLAGAAGLAVGELLIGGLEGAEVAGAAGLAGGDLLSGSTEETQAAGMGAAGGMSALEEAELVGGAAAAGLAAAGLAAEGYAAGEATQLAGGAASGAGAYASGTTQGAGEGVATTGAVGAGQVASGGTRGGGQSGVEGEAGGISELAEAGIIGAAAGLAAASFAAEGYAAGEATQVAGGAAGGYVGGATQAAGSGIAAAGGQSGVAAGAAGVAGAGLAAGAVGGGTQAAGGGVVGGGVLPAPNRGRRQRGGRTLLIAIIIALLLLLVFGSIAAFALNMSQSSATVTLTLESHTVQNTYLVTATTTTTTTTGGQVQANFLKQTASLSQSGQASGYYSGAQASGFIKFYNSSTGCGCPVVIPAGTAFTGASGITVVTDEIAAVASLCNVTVHAHAVSYGPGGDIPANDVHASYSSKVTATNPFAFGGGQAGQSNALVQQSDIDHVAGSLKAQVVQSAQTDLQAQLQSNQRLFAQPVCKTKVKSDHAAGDYASSVNVTVTALCSAEAYDYTSAMQIVQQQVQSEASSYSSDQYVLVNGLQTTVSSATVTDAKAGAVLLAFKVVGRWLHKLSRGLERFIAGKSISDARAILKQFGAAQVDISISGFNSSTLPTDSSRIKIVVKS